MADHTDDTEPVFSLRRTSSAAAQTNRLFRAAAGKPDYRNVLGRPTTVLPPAGYAAAALALAAILLLAVAAWLVEVPQTANGIGVIMPSHRLTPIEAPTGGQVHELLVQEKQRVRKGELVLRIAASGSLDEPQSPSATADCR